MMNSIQNGIAARRAATLGMTAIGIAMLSGCLLEELGDGGPQTRRSPVRAGCALLDDQEPNNTATQATPLELGSVLAACLDDDDEDHFTFRAPPVPASGGYVKLQFSDVDPDLRLDVFGYVASNNFGFERIYAANDGAAMTFYWAVDPNADYRFLVQPFLSSPPGAVYALEATWNPIVDPFEPNQNRETAAPLEVNTTIEAYFNTGAASQTPATDWYSLELQSGAVRFDLADPPSDIRPDLRLFDSKGAEIFREYASNRGAEITVDRTIEEPGTYYLSVALFTGVSAYQGGTNTTVPAHFVQPYGLTVTQP
jgi:hypothetical protein